jgi:hypothetical protein
MEAVPRLSSERLTSSTIPLELRWPARHPGPARTLLPSVLCVPAAGQGGQIAVIGQDGQGLLGLVEGIHGDDHVVGTGTIDAEGDVGPIGGIRQKMIGASQAGADLFIPALGPPTSSRPKSTSKGKSNSRSR